MFLWKSKSKKPKTVLGKIAVTGKKNFPYNLAAVFTHHLIRTQQQLQYVATEIDMQSLQLTVMQ